MIERIRAIVPPAYDVSAQGNILTISRENRHVDMNISAPDLSLSDDDLRERILQPALCALEL